MSGRSAEGVLSSSPSEDRLRGGTGAAIEAESFPAAASMKAWALAGDALAAARASSATNIRTADRPSLTLSISFLFMVMGAARPLPICAGRDGALHSIDLASSPGSHTRGYLGRMSDSGPQDGGLRARLGGQAVPDEELVARCRAELPGETEAFRLLVERHHTDVYATCFRLLGSREDAEEATQDTFMRLLHSIAGFRGEARFRTWLLRIAHNISLSRLARSARRSRLEHEFAGRDDWTHDESAGDDAGADRSDADDPVQAILARMSLTDREILSLRFAADLTLEEVAKTLGLSLSAAKMRLYRAEERFRAWYLQNHFPL